MKVKILIEFEVESLEDEAEFGELTEETAKVAAGQAAFDYLSFVRISGHTSSCDEVEVHVDGFGKCSVKIGEDHE